ncbi:MAG TPA: CBS domain-containing protein [Nitrospiria bacterium]|nr:CBS domain-containing protein [Nitrospiria bacterium]
MAQIIVRELMTPNPITVEHGQTVGKAAELMARFDVRRLPVLREGKLVGIISDRDVRQMSGRPSVKLQKTAADEAYLQLPVEEAMTLNVITIRESQPVKDAIALLLKHKIGGLPVLGRDGGLVGVLSEQDVLKHCLGILEREADR